MSPPLTCGGLLLSLGGPTMYRALWPILSAALFLIATAAAPAAAAPEVAQAEQLYNDGKFKESIAVLDPYLKAHPNDAAALVDRGDDYEALGDHQTAIADYTAASASIRILPMHMPRAASRTSSRPESTRRSRIATKPSSSSRKLAYAYRVRAPHRSRSRNPKAPWPIQRSAGDLAVERDGAREPLPRVHGAGPVRQCHGRLQRTRAAINPNLDTAFFYRARAEYLQENYKASIADFTTGLRLDPTDNNAYYWIAEARSQRRDRMPTRSKTSDQYIATDADDADGHLLRAQIEAEAGQRRRGPHLGTDRAQTLPHRKRRDRRIQGAGAARFARRGAPKGQ